MLEYLKEIIVQSRERGFGKLTEYESALETLALQRSQRIEPLSGGVYDSIVAGLDETASKIAQETMILGDIEVARSFGYKTEFNGTKKMEGMVEGKPVYIEYKRGWRTHSYIPEYLSVRVDGCNVDEPLAQNIWDRVGKFVEFDGFGPIFINFDTNIDYNQFI